MSFTKKVSLVYQRFGEKEYCVTIQKQTDETDESREYKFLTKELAERFRIGSEN